MVCMCTVRGIYTNASAPGVSMSACVCVCVCDVLAVCVSGVDVGDNASPFCYDVDGDKDVE